GSRPFQGYSVAHPSPFGTRVSRRGASRGREPPEGKTPGAHAPGSSHDGLATAGRPPPIARDNRAPPSKGPTRSRRPACLALLGGLALLAPAAAAPPRDTKGKLMVEKSGYGKTPDGTPVFLYTLTNSRGMTVKITNYGGTVTELHVPDKDGKTA